METVIYSIKCRTALWSKVWKEEIPYSAHELAKNFVNLASIFP